MQAPSHTFTFLGTGAGCGVPAFFCDCSACKEARENPRAQRGCCGVLIEGEKRLLIDTPPDLRHQLVREHIKSIDHIAYTHAHFDHLSGLGELEYLVRLFKREGIPTHASSEAIAGIEQEFGYMFECLDMKVLKPFESFTFDGASYTALPVAHAAGTYGYLIETPATKLFYASDTGKLPESTAEQVRGVDILIMDATFWKRNWSPEVHRSVQETIEEGFELEVGTTYLTHLSMHYDEPITLVELENYLEQYNGRVKVALDGMKLAI